MKPLELTVYPEINCGAPCNCDMYLLSNDDMVMASSVDVEAKRLTDADLAAEYFSALAHFERMGFNEVSSGDDWDDATWARIAKPMQTIHRFATLPHYDESPDNRRTA